MLPNRTRQKWLRLPHDMRELLMQHANGPVPFEAHSRKPNYNRSLRALIGRELVTFVTPGAALDSRPKATYLTDAGREAVAAILAYYADVLSLFLKDETGKVAEAKYLDEAGKLILLKRALDTGDRKLLRDNVFG